MKSKVCSTCQVEKDLSDFPVRKDRLKYSTKALYRSQCRQCMTEKQRLKDRKKPKELHKKPGSKPYMDWSATGRECKKCGEFKTWGEYRKQVGGKNGYYATCRTCLLDRQRSVYKDLSKDQKQVLLNKSKNSKLMKQFGLSLEDVERMKAEQDNKCQICQRDTELLVIDHCHSQGTFRGLLCNGCNSGLGLFKENIHALQRAIKYLEEYALKQSRDPRYGPLPDKQYRHASTG